MNGGGQLILKAIQQNRSLRPNAVTVISYIRSLNQKSTMKITKLLAVLAIAAITFVGCSKDDNNSSTTPTLSKTQLLTGHSWKETATYFDGTPFPVDSCDMDNIINFYTNGIQTEDAGAIKCNVTDPQVDSTTWSFTDNETKVLLSAGTPDEASASLLQLDASTLKLRFNVNDSLLGSFNLDIVFSKR